jgi:hypothetical protein
MKRIILVFILAVISLCTSGTSQAVTTQVTYVNGPQDPLIVPSIIHELGVNYPWAPFLFPPNETITSNVGEAITPETSCFEPDSDSKIPNVLVTITNITGLNWTEVWYVADPETTLTNHDGWVNGQLAFKIDNVGINRPLVFESMNVNNIFENGEVWTFIIQDYTNSLGISSSFFGSIGVPSVGDLVSSGSIIAIPAPGAILLCSLGAGLAGFLRRRRSL